MVQSPERLPDKILDFCDVGPMEHHDAGLTYPQYVQKRYVMRGLGLIPDLVVAITEDHFDGEVDALIDAGMWKAICSMCRTAMVVCHHVPFWMCVGCGNTANGGVWMRTIFPYDRAGLEAALLTIPGFRSHAPDRWYRPGKPIPALYRGD